MLSHCTNHLLSAKLLVTHQWRILLMAWQFVPKGCLKVVANCCYNLPDISTTLRMCIWLSLHILESAATNNSKNKAPVNHLLTGFFWTCCRLRFCCFACSGQLPIVFGFQLLPRLVFCHHLFYGATVSLVLTRHWKQILTALLSKLTVLTQYQRITLTMVETTSLSVYAKTLLAKRQSIIVSKFAF